MLSSNVHKEFYIPPKGRTNVINIGMTGNGDVTVMQVGFKKGTPFLWFKTDTINFLPPYLAFCNKFDLIPFNPLKEDHLKKNGLKVRRCR